MAIHVKTPRNWADAELDKAVWSDPRPAMAILLAIAERAAVCGASSETTIHDSFWREPFTGMTGVGFSYVRPVPSGMLAQILRHGVLGVLDSFVDLDYDYGARDWTEFPRRLSTAWYEDKHGHPMGIEPGVGDGETPEALESWRTFLGDCRWWLDRCTAFVPPDAWWHFTRRVKLGGTDGWSLRALYSADGDEDVSESGPTMQQQLAVADESEGVWRGYCSMDLTSTTTTNLNYWAPEDRHYVSSRNESERATATIYTNLFCQNRTPLSAVLRIVARGYFRSTRGVVGSRTRTQGFDDTWTLEEGDQLLSMFPGSIHETDRTAYGDGAGTHTTTKWTRDYTDSLSETEPVGAETLSDHTDVVTWLRIPAPQMLGLSALGLQGGWPVEAHRSVKDLLAWGGFDPSSAIGSWAHAPAAAMETDAPENLERKAGLVLSIVPVLDFSQSFNFRANQ